VSFDLPEFANDGCVFCSIVVGDTEASWEVRPTGDSRVACFHNRLKWSRIMLLVVPVEHMTQEGLWKSDVLVDTGRLIVAFGDKHCGDEGFRAISNFGLQAHQSQIHGHIHLVSGTSRQIQTGDRKSQHPASGEFDVNEYEIEETPFAARIAPSNPTTQRKMWSTGQLLETSQAAFEIVEKHSADGFRLISSFEPANSSQPAGSNDASLFVLGGGQLGLYV
jgi:diadenosine tetraphosphate (Ap4A) HIT family hydrolase|tara:strand:- start:2602 stop:3264 length:663 start_codon:yes stop_codon:yes gene_type:complete